MNSPAGVLIASFANGVIINDVQVETRGQVENVAQPVANATVYAYQHVAGYAPTSSSAPATVYADQSLTTPLSQPLTTDVNGNVPGYVERGQLIDLVASRGGLPQPQVLFLNAASDDATLDANGNVPAAQLGNAAATYVAGATGDPAADTPAICTALMGASASRGGKVMLQAAPESAPYVVDHAHIPAIYNWDAPITLDSFVGLEGAGAGATWVKLAAGSDCDLFQTARFSEYTGTTQEVNGATPMSVPTQFALRDLVLDQNGGNQNAGWTARSYGSAFDWENVEFRGGWAGALWSEFGSSQQDGPGGYPDVRAVEARLHNVRFSNFYCNGAADATNSLYGVYWIGPHDSVWENVHIWSFETCQSELDPPERPYQYGLVVDSTSTSSGAGLQVVNLHVYGRFDYGIDPRVGGVWFADCESESSFIANLILRSGCTWTGGAFYDNGGGGGGVQIGPIPGNANDTIGCSGAQVIGPYVNFPNAWAFDFAASWGGNIIIATQHQGSAPLKAGSGQPNATDIVHVLYAWGTAPTNGPAGTTATFSQDNSLLLAFNQAGVAYDDMAGVLAPCSPLMLNGSEISGVLAGSVFAWGIRLVPRKTGVLHDLTFWVGTPGGNAMLGVYDTGQAASGQRTRLAASPSTPVTVTNGWQPVWDPAIPITAGVPIDLVIQVDNVTVTIAATSSPTAIAALPAGYLPDTGGISPTLAWNVGNGYGSLPATIAAGAVAPYAFFVPFIMGRIE